MVPSQEPTTIKKSKEIPPEERRYVVAWDVKGEKREVVVVYDKVSRTITYKVDTSDRRKHAFPYIQKYYGKGNCNFLGKKDLRIFE